MNKSILAVVIAIIVDGGSGSGDYYNEGGGDYGSYVWRKQPP